MGRYQHTVSLQALTQWGVALLGRAVGIRGEVLEVDDRLADHVRFADEKSTKLKEDIDAYRGKHESDAVPLDDDVAHSAADTILWLNLRAAGINTIIWCTGFIADFSWIAAPVTDAEGRPLHESQMRCFKSISQAQGFSLSMAWSRIYFGLPDTISIPI